jgi:hypothetical protein
MSGEASTLPESPPGRIPVGSGPQGPGNPSSPFTASQLTRLDEALTVSSRESGIRFSVYIGALVGSSRAAAEQLFSTLTDDAVLVAVAPGQRVVHIVTGKLSTRRLPNSACALAALSMRSSFAQGDLIGGLVNGLRQLSEAAGTA